MLKFEFVERMNVNKLMRFKIYQIHTGKTYL